MKQKFGHVFAAISECCAADWADRPDEPISNNRVAPGTESASGFDHRIGENDAGP